MGTNFPASDDVFTEPSAPASTALDSAGDSSRDMTDNHEDLGLAIMALQAEATLVGHVHDGTTRNGPKLLQSRTHESSDVDSSATALHHTIGTGANQGAAGNHSHSAAVVWPVSSIFITEIAGNPNPTHGLPGTWTQIQGAFIVAAGSTFTGGSSGGSTSHSHTATFSTAGGHTHTSPSTDAAGSHSHTSPGTSTDTFSHTHGTTGSGNEPLSFRYRSGSGATSMVGTPHTHSTAASNSSSHSHTVSTSDSISTHQHTVAGIDSQGGHTHTSSITSSSHIPPYLSVYVWERTA